MGKRKNPAITAPTPRIDTGWNIDGWANVFTGLGMTGKDKALEDKAYWLPLTQMEAEVWYAADDVSKRMVNEVVDEGVREWIDFKHEDDGLKSVFSDEFDRLQVRDRFTECWKWGRAYGGAATLIVTNSPVDFWWKPLDILKEGGIKSLLNFSRDELSYDRINEDVGNANFGMPVTYNLAPHSSTLGSALAKIHHTRLLRFDGELLPRRLFVKNNYWHDSIINARMEAIRNFNSSHLYSNQAIADFSVVAVQMRHLAELIQAGKSSEVLQRLNLIKMGKSNAGIMLLDESETVTNLARTVTGLKDLVDLAVNRMVFSSGMPRTKILGESAGGLAKDGKGEDRTWYDFVARQQEIHLEKKLNYILSLVQLAPKGITKGKDVEMSYDFKPLWQMSEQENANVYKTTADADSVYISNGVVMPDQVARARFTGDKFSQDLKIEEADIEAQPKEFDDPEDDAPKIDNFDHTKLDVVMVKRKYHVRYDGKTIKIASRGKQANKFFDNVVKKSQKVLK